MSFPQALFSTPSAFVRRGLDALARTVDQVMPLTGARRRDAPDACRELSALLTSRRDELARPYWTSPRLTSAYLRYVLPWNLVRLTALLPGLPLDAPRPAADEKTAPRQGGNPDEFLVFDLGSGPCTFPLALWLARPDWRRRAVTVAATDSAPHILDLGRRIFEALRAELDPASPWILRTWRAPLHAAPGQLRGRPRLITLGNVLNELEERERRGTSLRDTLATLLDNMAGLLAPGGRVLAVEPGTRQGGRLISTLRDMALGRGMEPDEDEEPDMPLSAANQAWDGNAHRFRVLAPCPHHEPCPMLARGVKAWCHVHAPAGAAPGALTELSRAAGLSKESVSLSFLCLERDGTARSAAAGRGAVSAGGADGSPRLRARVISDAFVLPDMPGRARYACTEQGLALIPDAAFLPPGALCEVCPEPRTDAKSGARIMTLPGRGTGADDQTARPDAPRGRLREESRTAGRKRHTPTRASSAPSGRNDARQPRPRRPRPR
ncbi:MAG: hypothetical protein J1E80_08875 [Desulfovibrionaceae bacterium]|nr:hypothetical protein [Desulfovibrionaceae bacterium]